MIDSKRSTEIDLFVQFVQMNRSKCPRCQYSLSGIKTNKCPECGIEVELGVVRKHIISIGWLVGLIVLSACFGFCAQASIFGWFNQIFVSSRPFPGLVAMTLISFVVFVFTIVWICLYKRVNQLRSFAIIAFNLAFLLVDVGILVFFIKVAS